MELLVYQSKQQFKELPWQLFRLQLSLLLHLIGYVIHASLHLFLQRYASLLPIKNGYQHSFKYMTHVAVLEIADGVLLVSAHVVDQCASLGRRSQQGQAGRRPKTLENLIK